MCKKSLFREISNVPASNNPLRGRKKKTEINFTKRLQWLFVITQCFVKALRRVVAATHHPHPPPTFPEV